MTSLYDISSLFLRSDFLPLGFLSGVPTELLVSVAPPSDSAPVPESTMVFSSSDFSASLAIGSLFFLAGFSKEPADCVAISIHSFSGSIGVLVSFAWDSFGAFSFT